MLFSAPSAGVIAESKFFCQLKKRFTGLFIGAYKVTVAAAVTVQRLAFTRNHNRMKESTMSTKTLVCVSVHGSAAPESYLLGYLSSLEIVGTAIPGH